MPCPSECPENKGYCVIRGLGNTNLCKGCKCCDCDVTKPFCRTLEIGVSAIGME